MNIRSACSKARTAAKVPGDGGFFGGAGSGTGTSARRLASIAFLDADFVNGFFGAPDLAGDFLDDAFFGIVTFRFLAGATATLVFFDTTFLVGRRLATFFGTGFPFLACRTFFPIAGFFAFGAAVILPGRWGFLEVAFLPLVARIRFDADKPLLDAFVIRLLISHLGVENEPAPRLNPAHTPVYGLFYINNHSPSQENTSVPERAPTDKKWAPD